MKKLIIGTTNEAKVRQIRGALASIRIEIGGVESKELLPELVEDGKTALENARKKALVYARALDKTVLSMDNALYLEGLEDSKQPGLNVRRIPGSTERPSDEELLNYYSKLIGSLGERVKGHWEFAVCVANSAGKIWETAIISPRIFVSRPSEKMIPGYPLESVQIDPETGQYISEMSPAEQDSFWQKNIGAELYRFIQAINLF